MNLLQILVQKCILLCALSSVLLLSTVLAQGTATYTLTFTSTWSASTHPINFPSSPHFSPLIGGTHNSSVSFWNSGSTASTGIKNMAELGSTSALSSEVNQAIRALNAGQVISGGGIGRSPGSASSTFKVTADFHLVTVTSMLAPSPDWFVGVSGLNLLDGSNNWKQREEVELFVYDAGTDSGTDYTSSNSPTNPRENISGINTSPFLVNGTVKSVGTFVFVLQSSTPTAPGAPTSLSATPDGQTAIDLSWTAPASDGGAPITGYKIEVSIDEGGSFTDLVANTGNANTSYSHTGLSADTRRDYRVSAINSVGTGPVSNEANATTDSVKDTPMPEVSLSADQNSVAEGDLVKVTVELSAAQQIDVTVPLILTAGTAESDDFDNVSPVNVVISSGQTKMDHLINTYEDADTEDETFSVAISKDHLPDGIILGAASSIEITITDKDLPGISAPSSIEVDEGKSEEVSISLMTQPSSNVSVTITGHANADLTPDPQVLTFTPDNYNAPQTVTLTTNEDEDLINDEVTLTLQASGGGYDDVSVTLTITIRDNMGVNIEEEPLSTSITLWGNYPNPVSDHTTIVFDLPEPAQISVLVVDLLGRTIQTTPYGWYGSGTGHTVEVVTQNLTSGIYYYTLMADLGDQLIRQSKSMSIMR